jgi:hypothetical protein
LASRELQWGQIRAHFPVQVIGDIHLAVNDFKGFLNWRKALLQGSLRGGVAPSSSGGSALGAESE